MSCATHGGRPHSNPPFLTPSLKGRVGVHVGLAEVDEDVVDEDVVDEDVVDEDVDDVVDVEEEVLIVEVERVDVSVGLQEQAEL